MLNQRSVLQFLLIGAIAAASLECTADDAKLPEFFGVYIKLTTGQLVELQSVRVAASGSVVFGDQIDYVPNKPKVAVNASEIDGFYVYGDYGMSAFALTLLTPMRDYKPALEAQKSAVSALAGTAPGQFRHALDR